MKFGESFHDHTCLHIKDNCFWYIEIEIAFVYETDTFPTVFHGLAEHNCKAQKWIKNLFVSSYVIWWTFVLDFMKIAQGFSKMKM